MQPIKFSSILKNTSKLYLDDNRLKDCPEAKRLVDFIYGELDEKASLEITHHINQCATCGIAALRISADRSQWEFEMENSPENAILNALGPDGRKAVVRLIGSRPLAETISSAKEAVSTWLSPLWMPKWAGQAVTASDVSEQQHHFDLGDGEYINLHCQWEGEQTKKVPLVKVSWSANIFTPSRIWVQFVDIKTNETISELSLGSDLEGFTSITSPALKFDPTSRPWGLRMFIESF